MALDSFLVKDGDWVVLIDNETRYSFAQITANSLVRLGRKQVSCAPLRGAVYGSYFELDSGKFHLIDPRKSLEALAELVGEEAEGTAAPDNKELVDYNTSQSMKEAEILAMKSDGKKDELVAKLVSNSSTFAKRTEFSQEKYLRRKTNKHRNIIQVLKPTAQIICQAYFIKKSYRIHSMRPDALAHIVTLANFQYGSRCVVIDGCNGLICGTAAERLGGNGIIFNVHQGKETCPSIIRLFNLSEPQLATIRHVPIAFLQKNVTASTFRLDSDDEGSSKNKRNDDDSDLEYEKESNNDNRMDVDPMETPPSSSDSKHMMSLQNKNNTSRKQKDYIPRAKRDQMELDSGVSLEEQQQRKEAHLHARKIHREQKFKMLSDYAADLEKFGTDSLVIAGPPVPIIALKSFWPYLRTSGNFVIFSEYSHSLVECYEYLYELGETINIRLTETWHRKYQVLPKRTHPLMNMPAASGFLLSGIKSLATPESDKMIMDVAGDESASTRPAKRVKTWE